MFMLHSADKTFEKMFKTIVVLRLSISPKRPLVVPLGRAVIFCCCCALDKNVLETLLRARRL